MKKFEQLQSKLETNESWAVQVYGRNRRLLCVLDSSHGWIFLAGCGVGLLVSVIWINAARYSSPIEPAIPTEAPALQVD